MSSGELEPNGLRTMLAKRGATMKDVAGHLSPPLWERGYYMVSWPFVLLQPFSKLLSSSCVAPGVRRSTPARALKQSTAKCFATESTDATPLWNGAGLACVPRGAPDDADGSA